MKKSEFRDRIFSLVESKLDEDDTFELSTIIDDIESAVQSARDILDDIEGIGDLQKVEDARDAIDNLADALY